MVVTPPCYPTTRYTPRHVVRGNWNSARIAFVGPIEPSREERVEITGIGGFIILMADIYAIVMILQSSALRLEKLIWPWWYFSFT